MKHKIVGWLIGLVLFAALVFIIVKVARDSRTAYDEQKQICFNRGYNLAYSEAYKKGYYDAAFDAYKKDLKIQFQENPDDKKVVVWEQKDSYDMPPEVVDRWTGGKKK
jgi:uncharacterized protein with FMN-binding domain